MSYDYYMFKKPPLCPKWVGRLRALLNGGDAIGTDVQVKAALSALFPQLVWQEEPLRIRLPDLPRKDTVLFGGPSPEFQIDAAPDGVVTGFVMRRANPDEIRTVERRLGVVAMDMQRDGFLGIIFGSPA